MTGYSEVMYGAALGAGVGLMIAFGGGAPAIALAVGAKTVVAMMTVAGVAAVTMGDLVHDSARRRGCHIDR